MRPLLDRRLLFVTGKGGVGKTSVAAGLGLLAARRGLDVLVCEVDAKGDLGDVFELGPLTFDPRRVQDGLDVMAMETEASLREYLKLQLRLPFFARIGPLARTFDYVATAAPGVKEILTVGKLAWEVREDNYDLVIVDGPATGHVIGQLAAAEGIRELVQVGLIRSQTQWMLDLLNDPDVTGVVVTTAPEEMPVNEALELVARLESETAVDLAAVVVNRVLPELFGRAEQDVFDALGDDPAREILSDRLGPGSDALLAAADLAVGLRRSRTEHLARLREGIADRTPLVYVPELFLRTHGRRATTMIADALEAELT